MMIVFEGWAGLDCIRSGQDGRRENGIAIQSQGLELIHISCLSPLIPIDLMSQEEGSLSWGSNSLPLLAKLFQFRLLAFKTGRNSIQLLIDPLLRIRH